MASTEELRDLLTQIGQRTLATQTQTNALAAEVRGLAANVGAVPGATPPVLIPVRKSSETTVQLSLSDEQ